MAQEIKAWKSKTGEVFEKQEDAVTSDAIKDLAEIVVLLVQNNKDIQDTYRKNIIDNAAKLADAMLMAGDEIVNVIEDYTKYMKEI